MNITKHYSDTSESLWQFKREDEQNMNNGNPAYVTTSDSSSFKYKSSFIGKSTAVGGNALFKKVKQINRLDCYFIKQRQCKTGKTIRRRI